MKKILFLTFTLILCLSVVGCGKNEVSEEIETLIIEKCDEFVESYDYENTVLYTVKDISYTINEIGKKADNEYLVDITWNIEFSDTCITESSWSDDWLATVKYILSNEDFVNPKNGKKFTVTHTKEDYYDSVRVIVNENDAYSGLDDFKENVGDPDEIKNSIDGVKCQSCGRRYQKDSNNAKSISRTNMCTDCYNEYKNVSDALKEVPLD